MSNNLKYDVKIQSIRPEGTMKATATVNINDAFAVRGVKLMEGSKGLFVSMPSYKAGNGEYKDICFPCTAESRKEFDKAVISAYEQALSQNQKTKQKQDVPMNDGTQSPVMGGM
jgi:stage V sporulation protein G